MPSADFVSGCGLRESHRRRLPVCDTWCSISARGSETTMLSVWLAVGIPSSIVMRARHNAAWGFGKRQPVVVIVSR